MARLPRIEGRGIVYHIICRGNNKEHIFREEAEKNYYLNQIREYKKAMGYKIYGYVFMDNHYHLILQTLDKNLSEIMHNFNTRFSKYFNRKYQRTGHVFENRYKAIPVTDDRYLLSLLRYVHQNPVRAGICNYVKQYNWSSDVFYRKNIRGFVDIDLILTMITKNRANAIKEYRRLVEIEESADFETISKIGENPVEAYNSDDKDETNRKTLDEILKECCDDEGDYILIKQGSRKRYLTPYKLTYAKIALEEKYTMTEIGENINISATAVYDLLKRQGTVIHSDGIFHNLIT